MKLVLALWQPDTDALLSPRLREELARTGATRLQVNLDDEHVPASALRLQELDEPLTCVVSVWTGGSPEDVVGLLRPLTTRLAGWQVEERVPLAPPETPDGARLDALAQVALLRRPPELPYEEWLAHWQGPHTRIAMETQASFGYVQDRVTGRLTEDTPHVDALVEELFPAAAVHDIHAFYGSDGSQEELGRRMTRLMESVATMGADRHLDVVPTSRRVFELSPP